MKTKQIFGSENRRHNNEVFAVINLQQLGFESRHAAKYCTAHKVKNPGRRTGSWELREFLKAYVFHTKGEANEAEEYEEEELHPFL